MNRLAKRPAYKYIPSTPAVIGHPAYCYVETLLVGRTVGSIKGSTSTVTIPVKNGQTTQHAAGVGYTVDRIQVTTTIPDQPYVVTNQYAQVQTCLPAVATIPGVPSKTITDNRTGWNSGARSVRGADGDMQFVFNVPTSLVGAAVGLSSGSLAPAYGRASHALVFINGVVSVVEHGVTVFNYGPGNLNSQYKVARVANIVSFYQGDDLIYTSGTPSAGRVYGDAVLYTVGDYVDSPAITDLAGQGSLYTQLVAPYAQIFDGAHAQLYTRSRAARAIIAGAAPTSLYVRTAPASALMRNYDYTVLSAKLLAGSAQVANDGPVIATEGVYASLPAIQVSMLMKVGGTGDMAVYAPTPSARAADYGYADVTGKFKGTYRTYFSDFVESPDSISKGELLLLGDRATVNYPMVIIAAEGLNVSSAATLAIFMDADAREFVGLTDRVSFIGDLSWVINETVGLQSSAAGNRQLALQYAVNILTGALSRYEGFGFNSFSLTGNGAYATKTDGLYRIGAATDDGELLQAAIDFGTSDYGDSHVKRIENAYMGINADGSAYLRIAVDGNTQRVYRLDGGTERRSRLAKNVAGRYWGVTLELVDVSFVSVDSLEMLVGVTQRRAGGRRQ